MLVSVPRGGGQMRQYTQNHLECHSQCLTYRDDLSTRSEVRLRASQNLLFDVKWVVNRRMQDIFLLTRSSSSGVASC